MKLNEVPDFTPKQSKLFKTVEINFDIETRIKVLDFIFGKKEILEGEELLGRIITVACVALSHIRLISKRSNKELGEYLDTVYPYIKESVIEFMEFLAPYDELYEKEQALERGKL